MNQEKIGKFISKLRKEKNLTQKELANLLKVNDKTISKWENGNYAPDIAYLIPLSELFGITIEELINGEKGISNKKEELITEEINKRTKKVKIRLLIISVIILIASISFFVITNHKNKIEYAKTKWDIISLDSMDEIVTFHGQLIHNSETIILNIYDISILDENAGTTEETKVKKVESILYYGNTEILKQEIEFDKPVPIIECMRNHPFIVEKKLKYNPTEKLELVTTTIDTKNREKTTITLIK